MIARTLIGKFTRNEGVNFFLANRIPRRLATRLVGWLAGIEQPIVRDVSIWVWRLFCNVDLRDAKKERFTSLRDCFIRELKDGARPIDGDTRTLVSPCDGIVGAFGRIEGGDLLQVKGSAYPLEELVRSRELAEFYQGGCYVTLRLTAGMYHRFHAPHDCELEQADHVWGDVWNVNPPALHRVERLFCKNERVIIQTRLRETGLRVTLVPVAAILVAGIRLRLAGQVVDPRRPAALEYPSAVTYRKGEEMGWFEHGSTVILLGPERLSLTETLQTGAVIRMGEALMRIDD